MLRFAMPSFAIGALAALVMLGAGCGRAKQPAKADLCQLAVSHVMALGAASADGPAVGGAGSAGAPRAAADAKLEASTIAACQKEGLSQAQADCILAARSDAEFAAMRKCPAIAAKAPGWLVVAPTDEELKELKDMIEPPVGPVKSPAVFQQLVANGTTTCGLADGGALTCWGQQVEVPSGSFTTVGWRWHLCGLDAEGKLACALHFAGEQLSFLPAEPLSAFAEGQFHGCGVVKATGALTCWSREGWLGDGTQFKPPGGKYTAVGSSSGYSCAIKGDRSVACFGANAPAAPKGAFVALHGLPHSMCGLRVDGTVACWGDVAEAIGKVPAGAHRALSCGERHCCALREDGAVTCWGDPEDGRVAAPEGTFATVMAGPVHSCASGANGTVCWGRSNAGQTAVPQAPGSHTWRAEH